MMKRSVSGILVMRMFLSDLAQRHNLEGIPLFRQPLFEFTSDVTNCFSISFSQVNILKAGDEWHLP